MNVINSIKNIDQIYLIIKKAYRDKHIPLPYPAANKQLQSRLHVFVNKGLTDNQAVCTFDKVNSHRSYFLQKHNDIVQLMMEVKEKDQEAKKLILLPVDDEIKLIVTTLMDSYEASGFIESAPKCHKRLRDTFAISDGRIRLVQRILAQYVLSTSMDNNSGGEDKGGECKCDKHQADEHKDDERKRGGTINEKISRTKATHPMPNDENSPSIPLESRITTRSKTVSINKCKNARKCTNNGNNPLSKRSKNIS